MAAQLAGLPAPALVVLDGETELTTVTQQLWPTTPIQPTPHWARHLSDQLGELLRDTIRHEQTTDEAQATWDAFARHADLDVTMRIYAHTNLDTMREALDKIDWCAE